MALVSIDLEAMESLIADLTAAKDTLPSAASTISAQLDNVFVTTLSVEQVRPAAAVWTWVEDRLRDLHRRLALARLVAGSSPGVPAVGVVEIDEDYVSDLSDAELSALVGEVQEAMALGDGEYSTDIDPRLVEILQEHAHDPYFAKLLAERVSPKQLDYYLLAVNQFRNPANLSDEEAVQEFDTRYDSVLNGLGMAVGLASQGTGDLRVDGLTERWTTYLDQAAEYPNGAVQRLTLVMSRGTFSTEMLIGAHDVLKEHEGDEGAGAWGVGFGLAVHDPDLSKSPETQLVQDPMGPLFQAMGGNPEALRRLFAEGETTTVATDDGEVEVNAYLWHVLRQRGTDEVGIQQLVLGLQTGVASAPVEGEPAWQPEVVADLDAIVGAIEREVRIAEENKPPWYSAAGHFLLDLIGMVPGLGEPADGLNATWYLAEGNTTDAAISGAGMLPFAGWFSVGGKWVRRAFTAEEMASLQRAVDNGLDVQRMLPGGQVLRNLDDMRDPANFTQDAFLSPWQQKLFANRPWIRNWISGRKFDSYMAPNYPHNQVRVDYSGGRGGYAVLDSYMPGEQIVSRKLTQLNDVDLSTARSYIRELAQKYPEEAMIRNSPGNVASGLAGQPLRGDLVLQVPPQRGGSIPADLIEYAKVREIRIVDINGFDYTA